MPQKPPLSEKRFWRLTAGFLLAPLDSLYSLLKGIVYFCINPSKYVYQDREPGDRLGKTFFAIATLSRLASVTMAILCILGFMGISVLPIPLVTPITTDLTDGAFLLINASVITTFWTIVARSAGALLGSVCDIVYYRFCNKKLYHNKDGVPCKEDVVDEISHRIIVKTLTIGVKTALVGGAAPWWGEKATKQPEPWQPQRDGDLFYNPQEEGLGEEKKGCYSSQGSP